MSRNTLLRGLVFGLALLAAGFLGAWFATRGPLATAAVSPPAPGSPVQPFVRGDAPKSFAPVIKRVAPAVVSIYAAGAPTPRMLVVPGNPFVQPRVMPSRRPVSSGSGFLISADGYILTNNHVVEGAQEIQVVLQNEQRLAARLVGRDPATDLAVLKVAGNRFSYVDLTKAGAPEIGDWVIAIGNPFGLGPAATAGIISAEGRDLGSAFVDFVQIDAPINSGNSGGPSFDATGQLVGVNTAIFSPTGGNVGIGFAIPADLARTVAERLMAGQPVERGYMGASLQPASDASGEAAGAIVAGVAPAGPAARGGLRPGDVIVRADGQDIDNAQAITRLVTRKRPGETIALEVVRQGQRARLQVALGSRPPEETFQRQAE